MTGWVIATLGGSAGITALVLRGAISGAVGHAVKRYLGRERRE